MIITRPCPHQIPANDIARVTHLDDARHRRLLGFPLTDEAAPGHPRARLRPGTYACLPTGIVIRIAEIVWVRASLATAGAVLHARYTANGITRLVPLSDLTPSQFQQKDRAP